jgi:hypothetical protein
VKLRITVLTLAVAFSNDRSHSTGMAWTFPPTKDHPNVTLPSEGIEEAMTLLRAEPGKDRWSTRWKLHNER